MSATVNYAESYQEALQQRYQGRLYSERLWNSPSNNLIKWTGAKKVRLPKLLINAGRKDRSRRTITGIEANYENQWEDYTLENERYWSTLVDPSDIDETNHVLSIANITRVYNDEEKIPEKDKQMFSSLYHLKSTLGGGTGIHSKILNESNILSTFDDLMESMDENEVPSDGRVLYTTPAIKKILKNAQGISRSLSVQNNNQELNRLVSRLDEVEILTVPSARFKTQYDFTEGAKDDPAAKQIYLMLIHIPCMCAPEKYSFAGWDAPSASSSGNYLYYEQSYDDVILFKSKTDGIEFVTE